MGIVYEFSTPGVGMGGITGVICLVLGLMALSALPLHLGGLFLLVAGLVAIGLGVKIQTHGLLAVGGSIALLLGAIVLVDPQSYFGAIQRLEWRLFVPFVVTIVAAFLLLARVAAKALRKPALSGVEAMAGLHGTARTPFLPNDGSFAGMVFVDGARWQAVSDGPIEPGQEVVVVALLTNPARLRVSKVEKGAS
jgi:membrane-bound serine protease (ClpP class)